MLRYVFFLKHWRNSPDNGGKPHCLEISNFFTVFTCFQDLQSEQWMIFGDSCCHFFFISSWTLDIFGDYPLPYHKRGVMNRFSA